jgi:hypothetical protein
MAGERNLKQEISGFLVESRIGRGVQRLSRNLRTYIPLVNKEKPMRALEQDLGTRLSKEAELTLWELALDDLPDEFWGKQLETYKKPKPEDPSKSVN